MGATVREIVDDALTVIGEVSGAGVQTYSEDRMMADTVRTFNLLFKKYSWPMYTEWFRFQLSGVGGAASTDVFKHVRGFDDINYVCRDGQRTPLPFLPKGVNPWSLPTSTQLQFYSSLPVTSPYYTNRILQFWPFTSTEWVNVNAMVYPLENGKDWNWEDVMELDKDMIVNGVAFMTLSSDDLNPAAAQAQQAMMEMRFRDIVAAYGNHPVYVSGSPSVPDQWFVR